MHQKEIWIKNSSRPPRTTTHPSSAGVGLSFDANTLVTFDANIREFLCKYLLVFYANILVTFEFKKRYSSVFYANVPLSLQANVFLSFDANIFVTFDANILFPPPCCAVGLCSLERYIHLQM